MGFFTVITAMLILRFGPRSSEEEDKENENNEEEAEKDVPSTNLNDDYRSVPDSEVHIHEPASCVFCLLITLVVVVWGTLQPLALV